MNGKECRDGINIRVSAQAMMIVLTCAGMGLPSLEEDQKAIALEKINEVADVLRAAFAEEQKKNAAAEKETKEAGNDGDEQND